MKRREFLKRFGIGAAVAPVAIASLDFEGPVEPTPVQDIWIQHGLSTTPILEPTYFTMDNQPTSTSDDAMYYIDEEGRVWMRRET